MKKKVLVLGHNGMLGNCVVSYFSSLSSYEVLILNSRWGDSSFTNEIVGKKPDFIINCIGKIPQKSTKEKIFSEYAHLNISLPIELERLGIKVILPTTDCEFSGDIEKNIFYTKESKRDATDMYGASKALISLMAEKYFVNTKIIRTSIIGHEVSTNVSLLDWFLTSDSIEIAGYTNHLWNGLTTLQWSKEVEKMLRNWDGVEKLVQIGTREPASKYELLKIIANIYNLNKVVSPESTGVLINKCLESDFLVPDIKTQLKELKDFYKLN